MRAPQVAPVCPSPPPRPTGSPDVLRDVHPRPASPALGQSDLGGDRAAEGVPDRGGGGHGRVQRRQGLGGCVAAEVDGGRDAVESGVPGPQPEEGAQVPLAADADPQVGGRDAAGGGVGRVADGQAIAQRREELLDGVGGRVGAPSAAGSSEGSGSNPRIRAEERKLPCQVTSARQVVAAAVGSSRTDSASAETASRSTSVSRVVVEMVMWGVRFARCAAMRAGQGRFGVNAEGAGRSRVVAFLVALSLAGWRMCRAGPGRRPHWAVVQPGRRPHWTHNSTKKGRAT